jgi:thiol-disulfide isomerase/thioredoxin
MIQFLRYVRRAALVCVGIAIVAGVRALDGILGTGRFLFGLGLGLVLGVGSIFAFIAYAQRKARKATPLRQPPMADHPTASYDWKVVGLDGTIFPMEAVRGELLFLNIWSTMCPPCVAELPSIERLQAALVSDGVTFMCVATDGDRERVRKFVESNGWKLPFFVLADSEIPPVFDSDYVPATYVVSPDGFVVYQHTGAALWDDARVVSFLRGLSVQHRLSQAQGLAIPA